ncbi:MAG: CehA/McbA family metallohydrolase [Candidatus Aenigmatarchaeota archaeon]
MKNKNKVILIIIVIVILISIIVSTLFRIEYFKESQIIKEGYYIGNLHTHTTTSDGEMSYHEVIETAKSLGFDFIAITDHDTISFATSLLCPKEKRILCIIGEEVTSKDGHILAIGINHPIPPYLSAEETIKKIHEQGGIAISAHPDPFSLNTEKIKNLEIDAFECNPFTHSEIYNYSCELIQNFPYVYNSDAHEKKQLSIVANKCWMTNLSFEALKEAIKKGNCSEFKPKVI